MTERIDWISVVIGIVSQVQPATGKDVIPNATTTKTPAVTGDHRAETSDKN